MFSKVRTGQVRVLMGSTAKMGAGTNVQDRLVALHDLDCPGARYGPYAGQGLPAATGSPGHAAPQGGSMI